MFRISIVFCASLAAINDAAAVDPIPMGPGGGPIVCTPEMDKNKDGVCDWRDTLGPGGGGVVVANPSGGSIYPDPTNMPGLISMDTDERDGLELWTKTSWNERYATYHMLLETVPSSHRFRVGLESVDFDGDGSLDAIVGDPESDVACENAGAMHVFFGPLDSERPRTLEDADATIYGTECGGAFGAEIHAIEGEKGQVLVQVNGPRDGVVYQFSLDNLPGKASEGELVDTEKGGSWGWE